MATPTISSKRPRRKFRKFKREKVERLLKQAPRFFVFKGSARYELNGKIGVLKPDIHLNIGKHGRFKLHSLNKTSATIMHRARNQNNDRFIHIRTSKTVAIGHGMFLEQQ